VQICKWKQINDSYRQGIIYVLGNHDLGFSDWKLENPLKSAELLTCQSMMLPLHGWLEDCRPEVCSLIEVLYTGKKRVPRMELRTIL
jgi:hypothetical protein